MSACRTLQGVGQDDAAEWAGAVAGDGEAFGRLFDRHRDRVRRHAHRLAPTTEDAEDVVALTFLEAWRRRAHVRIVDGSVLPWLLVTASNVARNQHRAARRHRALLAKLPPASPVVHAPHDESGIVARLDELSVADRQVLVLCVIEGFSEREAAEALGVPPGTVKSRLSRARRRLAHAVFPEGVPDVS